MPRYQPTEEEIIRILELKEQLGNRHCKIANIFRKEGKPLTNYYCKKIINSYELEEVDSEDGEEVE